MSKIYNISSIMHFFLPNCLLLREVLGKSFSLRWKQMLFIVYGRSWQKRIERVQRSFCIKLLWNRHCQKLGIFSKMHYFAIFTRLYGSIGAVFSFSFETKFLFSIWKNLTTAHSKIWFCFCVKYKDTFFCDRDSSWWDHCESLFLLVLGTGFLYYLEKK